MQLSDGAIAGILGEGFVATFPGAIVRLYSGTRPANPGLPATGTHIGSITINGVPDEDPAGALPFERAGRYILLPTGAGAKARIDVNGTIGWWRLCAEDDDGTGADPMLPRIDGAATDSTTPPLGTTLYLPTLAVIAGDTYDVADFLYTLYPLPTE
jgi:hypothetical protein